MSDGYGIIDELWNERRQFSRFEAVCDMILCSENGRFEYSQRKIAFKWGRTRDWVRALLKKLQKSGIKVVSENGTTVVEFSVEQLAFFVEHTSQHPTLHPTLHPTNEIVNQQVAGINTPPYTPGDTPVSIPLKEQEAEKEESVPLNNPLYKEEKEEEKEKQKNSSLTSAMKRVESDLFGGAVAPLSTTSVDAAADVDWKKFLDFFNATVNGSQIPKIRTITEERKKFIRARVKEFGKNALAVAVKKAAASDFLNGSGNEAFIASFDWIFKPRNFPKVLEGNYDNKNLDYANRRDNGKTQRDIDRERRDREAAEIMSRLAEGLY